MLGGVREGVEQLQPLGQVADRFEIGGALDGALTCPLPVGNSLREETRLRVVLRQQFGLHCDRLRELLLQHLRNPLVVLLSGTLEE